MLFRSGASLARTLDSTETTTASARRNEQLPILSASARSQSTANLEFCRLVSGVMQALRGQVSSGFNHDFGHRRGCLLAIWHACRLRFPCSLGSSNRNLGVHSRTGGGSWARAASQGKCAVADMGSPHSRTQSSVCGSTATRCARRCCQSPVAAAEYRSRSLYCLGRDGVVLQRATRMKYKVAARAV